MPKLKERLVKTKSNYFHKICQEMSWDCPFSFSYFLLYFMLSQLFIFNSPRLWPHPVVMHLCVLLMVFSGNNQDLVFKIESMLTNPRYLPSNIYPYPTAHVERFLCLFTISVLKLTLFFHPLLPFSPSSPPHHL